MFSWLRILDATLLSIILNVPTAFIALVDAHVHHHILWSQAVVPPFSQLHPQRLFPFCVDDL